MSLFRSFILVIWVALVSSAQSGRPSLGPCERLSVDEAIRHVQESEAFREVLGHLHEQYFADRERLPQDAVSEYCSSLEKRTLDDAEEVAIVSLLASGGVMESRFIYFGVRPDEVVLLTEVRDGLLQSGVTLSGWNEFAAGIEGLEALLESKLNVLQFACIALSVLPEPSLCDDEYLFLVERGDQGWTLRLFRLARHVTISESGQMKVSGL